MVVSARSRDSGDGTMGDVTRDEARVRLLELAGPGASEARASQAMAAIFELLAASCAAAGRVAIERATELALRALALAEATLPADSLVTVHVRKTTTYTMACAGQTAELMTAPDVVDRTAALFKAAWENDARMVSLSRRNLEALGSRWRAGTLAVPSEAEMLYFSHIPGTDARGVGARMCAFVAGEVLFWPNAAFEAAVLRDAHDAITALLDADARGELFLPLPPGGRRSENSEDPVAAVQGLAVVLLARPDASSFNRTAQQRARLLRDLDLSRGQTDALAAIGVRVAPEHHGPAFAGSAAASSQANGARMRAVGGAAAASAAAAAAKYGLQRCALPACAAQEPAARTYKRCSRCGQAYYCCVAHQQADWKRHKHEDGCKKPAADAASA